MLRTKCTSTQSNTKAQQTNVSHHISLQAHAGTSLQAKHRSRARITIAEAHIGTQGKNHHAQQRIDMPKGHNSLTKQNKFCLVSVQQMQTLLILFSKSFSYFPHGTCLLSDSIIYSCVDGNYHLLCIPMPRNVTHQSNTVHRHVQMTRGSLTLFGAFFQQACTCTSIGNAIQNYNSKLAAPFFRMNMSQFIRNYLRNPFQFIFHSLLICLNSAGLNTSLHVRIAYKLRSACVATEKY